MHKEFTFTIRSGGCKKEHKQYVLNIFSKCNP